MKKLLQGVAVTCALMASPVYADDAFELEVTGNVGMYTKYIWRGWNVNDDTSVQGGFDIAYNGFTAGTWGGTDQELGTEHDIYVGYGREINEYVSFDVGYIQYRYPRTGNHVEEWHVTADFNFLSTTYHKGEDGYYYVEFNSGFELSEKITLDFHYGYEKNDFNEWNDYGVQVNYQINDRFRVFLAGAEKERGDGNIYAGLVAEF